MRNEIWRDGVLIEVIELEDPIADEVDATAAPVDQLIAKLSTTEVNSIAKLKQVLIEFYEGL